MSEMKEYLEEHGLPDKLGLFVETDGQVVVGEGLNGGAFRCLLVSCLQYDAYSAAVARDLVRAFYDDQIQRMYIAQVNSKLQAMAKNNYQVVGSFEDFCKLAIPAKLIKERDEILTLHPEEKK